MHCGSEIWSKYQTNMDLCFLQCVSIRITKFKEVLRNTALRSQCPNSFLSIETKFQAGNKLLPGGLSKVIETQLLTQAPSPRNPSPQRSRPKQCLLQRTLEGGRLEAEGKAHGGEASGNALQRRVPMS